MHPSRTVPSTNGKVHTLKQNTRVSAETRTFTISSSRILIGLIELVPLSWNPFGPQQSKCKHRCSQHLLEDCEKISNKSRALRNSVLPNIKRGLTDARRKLNATNYRQNDTSSFYTWVRMFFGFFSLRNARLPWDPISAHSHHSRQLAGKPVISQLYNTGSFWTPFLFQRRCTEHITPLNEDG